MTLFGSFLSESGIAALPVFGPAYQRLFGFLALWAPLTALAMVACWFFLRRFSPELSSKTARWSDHGSRFLYQPFMPRRDWLWLVLACSVLLLLTDWQGFTQGFFRWDDFAFIQDARENLPLSTLLRQYHNDHSLPLFRLWVSGVMAWTGPAATAGELARAFNLVNYATCLGVLVAGAALLSLCGARRCTVIAFCLFAWFWPGWGEITTGFYTLIVYPQTLFAGLLALIFTISGLRNGGAGWIIAGILCAIVAAGLDISGVWIFFTLSGFVWALHDAKNRALQRVLPWIVITFMGAAYYHLAWFHHPFVGREFIQNPLGLVVGHSLVDNLASHGWRIPLAMVSGLGATLLSNVTPAFIGLFTPQFLSHSFIPFIYAGETMALGVALWLGCRSIKRLTPSDRRLLGAFALPVAVLIGMTVVARAGNLTLPASLWPTKYLCVPQAWAVLTAVFLIDRVLLVDPAIARRAARWICGAALAGGWLMVTFWYLERALDIPTDFRPAGRQGNTVAAVQRREDFFTFQAGIQELARRVGRRDLDVPPPLGLYWAHPSLEFGYDPVRGGTYQFTDLLAVAPVTRITLRERPRHTISADVLEAIAAIPALQRVFDPTPPSS